MSASVAGAWKIEGEAGIGCLGCHDATCEWRLEVEAGLPGVTAAPLADFCIPPSLPLNLPYSTLAPRWEINIHTPLPSPFSFLYPLSSLNVEALGMLCYLHHCKLYHRRHEKSHLAMLLERLLCAKNGGGRWL